MHPSVSPRPYAGPADLAAMERLQSDAWRRHPPHVPNTVGDLEWWMAGEPDADWSTRIALWDDDRGRTVGWTWFGPPEGFDWFVAAESDGPTIRGAMLDWLEARARRARAGGDGDDPGVAPSLEAWACESEPGLGELLRARGLRPTDEHALHQWALRLDRPLVALAPPPGYRSSSMAEVDDLEARVAVHRAAFAPSRYSLRKQETLATLPHYRPELDLVVVAPDGSLAAFAIVWWDPDGRVGEFEPVGVDPAHRRRGLGRTVMAAGLARLRELGADWAVIFSLVENAASERLYAASGLEVVATHRRWRRPAGD